jgi:hypothetical protein
VAVEATLRPPLIAPKLIALLLPLPIGLLYINYSFNYAIIIVVFIKKSELNVVGNIIKVFRDRLCYYRVTIYH